MNIIQTTTGWLIKEEFNNLSNTTFIHQNTQTIKHIVKENKRVKEVYTLTLKKNNFTFTQWDRETLKVTNTIDLDSSIQAHLAWGIRTLRNQPIKNNKTYYISQELFGIFITGTINYNSQLAQNLYQKPGAKNLSILLFGNIEDFIIKSAFFYWNDIEGIYNCQWKNKQAVYLAIRERRYLYENCGLEELNEEKNIIDSWGKYMKLFNSQTEFINNIEYINTSLIKEYSDRNLGKIPQFMLSELINLYMRYKIKKDEKHIPTSLQHIHSLLGDPVKKRLKIKANHILLGTNKIEIQINTVGHFPILSLKSQATPEAEILLCEELGMRSPKYIPSKLKRYEL